MRAIIYALQVIVGGLIGAVLGRGAAVVIRSPGARRGCCAVLVVVVTGAVIFGMVAAP